MKLCQLKHDIVHTAMRLNSAFMHILDGVCFKTKNHVEPVY